MTTGAKPGAGQERERQKLFLVVVDGNPSNLFSTGMLLQRLGYTVFTAATAEEALQYMSIALPSALITELTLPAMSGMDLITRMKQDPRMKPVPVIVHTQMKDSKVEELCFLAGCAGYIRKPIEPNTLFRTIQQAMEATPRQYIRLGTCLKAVTPDETESVSRGGDWVTALSENGMYIRTSRPRPVNSLLPVTFFLQERRISVRAVVLYTFPAAAGPLKEPGMGVKFVDLSGEDREVIREFIKDELMKDLVAHARHHWRHEE